MFGDNDITGKLRALKKPIEIMWILLHVASRLIRIGGNCISCAWNLELRVSATNMGCILTENKLPEGFLQGVRRYLGKNC